VLLDDSLRLVRNAGIAGVDATVFVARRDSNIFSDLVPAFFRKPTLLSR
jgi:hypothetical protein